MAKATRGYALESPLTNEAVEYLRSLGFLAWRQNVGQGRYTTKDGKTRRVNYGFRGLSDVLAVLPGGRFLAVETKRWDNTTSGAQADFLSEVWSLGGLGVVAYSLDDIDTVLRKEGYVR